MNGPIDNSRETLNVRWLRRKLGWTQAALAERLDVDQGTVSRWERGLENPRPASFSAMRDLLLSAQDRKNLTRHLTVIKNDLLIAGLCDERLRLICSSNKERKQTMARHSVDISSQVGWEMERHAESLGLTFLYNTAVSAGFGTSDVLLLRWATDARGMRKVTHVEPIYEDGNIIAWSSEVVEHFELREEFDTGLVTLQAIYADSPGELTNVFTRDAATLL